MFKDLFAHSCVVITLYFIVGSIFRIYQTPTNRFSRIIFGLISGVIGSIIIFFNVKLSEYVILDLRHLAILISAFFGGTFSAIITTCIIAFTRFIFFPVGFSTYATIITLFIVCFCVVIIEKLKLSQHNKTILMLLCSTSLYSIMFAFVLSHYNIQETFVDTILLSYTPISLLGGYLTFYLTNYILSANHSYLELKKQAQFDYLTGLQNVRQFELLLEKESKKSIHNNRQYALFFIDIDYFKKVNDTYGHPAGDEILRSLSRLLIQSTSIKDYVFRNGGEEFSILTPNTDLATALKLAEKIRNIVEDHEFYLPNGNFISITVSIGVALSSIDQSVSDIIHQADHALYTAKNTGRNRIAVA